MSVQVRRPRPLFRPELKDAPGHPMGERVIVREFPVESETEGGIQIAETAKQHYFAGTLIAAGDQAADKLYDLGAKVGDEVWYAKYAGLIERWQHIVSEPPAVADPACTHDASWDFVPKDDPAWATVADGKPNENMELRSCRTCGAKKLSERVLVLSVDDLVLNVDLQVRLESGVYTRHRGETEEGRTRYVIARPPGEDDCFERIGR